MKNINQVEIKIDKLVSGGLGFAKFDNKPILVPSSAPGDLLLVKIIKSGKSYFKGDIIKILKPSPSRIEPICPLYGKCGGCDLQHISTSERKIYLNSVLKENLKRIGKLQEDNIKILNPILNSKNSYSRLRGRFKCAFIGKKFLLGLNRRKSNEIIEFEKCYLMSEKINQLIVKLKNVLSSYKSSKNIFFEVEITSIGKASALIFNFENKDLRLIEFVKENIFSDYIEVMIRGRTLSSYPNNFYFLLDDRKIHPKSFIQCNHDINKKIKSDIDRFINRDGSILDLYCGYGNLSLDIAKAGVPVTGIEENPYSLTFLDNNKNFIRIRGDVLNKLKELSLQKFSTIILDPPRTGALEVTKELFKFKAKKIVYLSCDSATLGRDLKILKDNYLIEAAQVYDMFPHTSHFETMVVLENKAFITSN